MEQRVTYVKKKNHDLMILTKAKGGQYMRVKAKDSLLKARAEQGMTIRELSDKSEVPIATISRAENGGTLSAKSAGRLCKALNQSFETLFIVEK